MVGEATYPDGVEVKPDNYAGSLLTRWEKIVLHSTESYKYYPSTSSYYGHQLWPHSTLARNDALGVWQIFNHLPLNRASACMRNLQGGVGTNRDGCIQIEIAWTAGQMEFLPKEALELLAKWMAWVSKQTGIPLKFVDEFHYYPPENGILLGKEPWRLRGDKWDHFQGVLGHQHADENVHGDPGKIDIEYIKWCWLDDPGIPSKDGKMYCFIQYRDAIYFTDFMNIRWLSGDNFNHMMYAAQRMPDHFYTVNGWVWDIGDNDEFFNQFEKQGPMP